MERLTERDEYGNADIIGVDSADLQLNLNFNEFNQVTEALNRLAAYEDTGLTPEKCAKFAQADEEGRYIVLKDREREGVERLREIALADKDGRLVVLPCKVGDTVYHHVCNDAGDGMAYLLKHHVEPIKFNLYMLDENGKLNKHYYLTREEAEAALAKEEQQCHV